MRIDWPDISAAARQTAEDLGGLSWHLATYRARVLLRDLADEVERLRALDRGAPAPAPEPVLVSAPAPAGAGPCGCDHCALLAADLGWVVDGAQGGPVS